MKLRFKSNLFILVSYFVFSLVLTFPLIFSLNSALPGGYGTDGFINLWNFDTFWQQLGHLQNPYVTHRILYPIGANLTFHMYNPILDIPAVLFFQHAVLYLNLLIIFGITLNCYIMYVLALYVLKNKIGAFFAGAIYGLSPIIFSFVFSQHYSFAIGAIYLPLGILLVLKFLETLRVRYMVWLILVFWLSFFTEYYFMVIYLLTVTSFFVIKLISLQPATNYFRTVITPKFVLSFLTTAIVAGLLPAYFVFTKLLSLSLSNDLLYYEGYANVCHTSILSFFVPAPWNPFLHSISSELSQYFAITPSGDTPSHFIGYLAIIAALSGILFFKVDKKQIAPFIIYGLLMLLLSFGPVISLGNWTLLSGPLTPFYWLIKLPFMSMLECPLRLAIGVQLVVSLLAGIAIGQVFDKFKTYRQLFFVLVCLLILFEYISIPISLLQIRVPSVYQKLAAFSDNKTVLELPSGLTESKRGYGYDWSIDGLHAQQMYWQTIYNKPRIGGYLSRIPNSSYTFFQTQPIISDLWNLSSLDGRYTNTEYSPDQVNMFIKKFNLGYIVLAPNPRQQQFEMMLDQIFGKRLVLVENQDGYVLFRLQ